MVWLFLAFPLCFPFIFLKRWSLPNYRQHSRWPFNSVFPEWLLRCLNLYNKDVLFFTLSSISFLLQPNILLIFFNLLLYVKSTYSLSCWWWLLNFFLERLRVIQKPLVYCEWVVWIASSTGSYLELATLNSIHHCGAWLLNAFGLSKVLPTPYSWLYLCLVSE